MNRRHLLRAAGAASIAWSLPRANAQGARVAVKLALNRAPYDASNAPFLLAQEKGYFGEEGLDVTMSLSKNATDAIRRVSTNEFDFGFVDGSVNSCASSGSGLRPWCAHVLAAGVTRSRFRRKPSMPSRRSTRASTRPPSSSASIGSGSARSSRRRCVRRVWAWWIPRGCAASPHKSPDPAPRPSRSTRCSMRASFRRSRIERCDAPSGGLAHEAGVARQAP